MVLPTPFTTASPQLANYSYSEISSGVSLNLFYGTAVATSSGTTFKLTKQTPYSYLIETRVAAGTDGTDKKAIDLDFDFTEFTIPQTLQGTGLIQLTQKLNTGAGETATMWVVAKVRKWNASTSTETEVASATSEDIEMVASTTNKKLIALPITIPLTTFHAGDTLRLTIEGYYDHTGGAGPGYMTIGHDPLNRDGTDIIPSTDDPDTITKLTFEAPFRL